MTLRINGFPVAEHRDGADLPLATNGRIGAGYGLFWRLPHATAPCVFTDAGVGEQAVHDSIASWLAWTDGEFTLALTGTDAETRADPWFVRVDDYPGVGSQLAGMRAVRLPRTGRLLVACAFSSPTTHLMRCTSQPGQRVDVPRCAVDSMSAATLRPTGIRSGCQPEVVIRRTASRVSARS